ncbi:MAG: hypothetical protein JWO36_4359 [Myxococcales bacterium]|nr:hypothetical protein [Myxococcales bacterium]
MQVEVTALLMDQVVMEAPLSATPGSHHGARVFALALCSLASCVLTLVFMS